MERGRGTVLRLTKLTESSLIVTWMTQELGLLKTVAKGARRPNSAFARKLDLFVSAELVWSPARSGELHYLREVSVLDFHQGLRKRYRNTVLAGYFGQLLEHVLEREHAVPELGDLLQRALSFLSEQEATMRAMTHFESELAKFLGLGSGGRQAEMLLREAYGSLPDSREYCRSLLGS